jgi:hypothetical protein
VIKDPETGDWLLTAEEWATLHVALQDRRRRAWRNAIIAFFVGLVGSLTVFHVWLGTW